MEKRRGKKEKKEVDIKRNGREYNGWLEASLQAATAIKESERIGIHPSSY